MTIGLLSMTALAGALYVLSPGPAFLALFSLAATHGRMAGARFVSGHLVGDVFWGTLAFAAIIGVNQLGPTLFDILSVVCGLYLIYLGTKSVLAKSGSVAPIGSNRPLTTGILFGLTNPKAYPVSVAMFTALTAHYAASMSWDAAPSLMAAAFAGFVAADIILVWAAGLAPVRRFFLRHGLAVARVVGILFIAFGAKSLIDAARAVAARD